MKEAFLEAADSLFEDFNKKTQIAKAIKKANSPQTSARQCVGMAVYVEEQLRKVIDACECFSLQSHELADMVDVAHLCVFIRLFFEDVSAKEELLTTLPLTGHTRGEDGKW